MASSIRLFVTKHPKLVNSGLVVLSIFITLLVLEHGFRLYLWHFQPDLYSALTLYHQTAQLDDSSMRFQPHPYTAFTRTDTTLNKNGMHIGEHDFTFKKPDEVIRIASLGGSTTMNQHPLHLKRYLELQFNSPIYESMDFGSDSWTTQESLINYMVRVKPFSPDIVIIHHGVNDAPPRIWGEYKRDYTNFRVPWQDQTGFLLRFFSRYSFAVNSILYFKGVMLFDIQNYVIRRLPPNEKREKPEPDSIHTFRRNLDTLFKLANADETKVIFAPVNYHPEKNAKMESDMMDEHRDFMLQYAKENHIPCVDTNWILMDHLDWFIDPVHLQPRGVLMNTQLFTAAIRDTMRGYSEVINSDGTIRHESIQQYDEKWIPKRRIRLKWGMHIPNITEYHIWVQEVGTNANYFLAHRDASVHSFEWKKDGEWVREPLTDGPEIGKDYFFYVHAVSGEQQTTSVGPVPEKGVFEVDDRIVFQPSSTSN